MMASDSCVKCITEDGSTTFTCDPEHLLRNVDIEHPAGELVLKALQSHKYTFGTGTKTLLFMLTSLAKAVVQLSKLGIHSNDSLDVIRDVFTDLAKEVQEISVDTNEFFHSSKQENFSRKIKSCTYDKNYAYMSAASDNPKSDRKLTACDEAEAPNTPEAVLQQHAEKHGLLNTHNDIVHKFYEVTWKSDGKIQDTQCSSTDPVLLKMSNLQVLSENVNDIDWFFDSPLSYPECTKAKSSLAEVHISHDTTKSSDRSLNCLCSGHQGCITYSFDSPEHEIQLSNLNSTENEIQWNGLNITSPFHNLKNLHSSELRNMGCINHESKLTADEGLHSLIEDEQHSSDFVNCFDEYDKKHSFEVANSISSGELDNNVNVSLTESCLVSKSNYFDSKLLSNIAHTAFNEDSKFVLADNQFSEKEEEDDDDEFNACFSDIDVCDSSVVRENAVKNVVYDDDEFSTCFSDIDVQDSSVPCEHVNGSEYTLPIHTLEMLNDIKQKHLFPKKSKELCGVKVTNGMSGKDLIASTFYRKGILKDTVRTSSMESTDIVTQKSEIERLNTLLEIFRGNKSPVDLPKLSRHLNHFQSQRLQPGGPDNNISANSKDVSNKNSLYHTGSIQYQGQLKNTFQNGGNLSSGISTCDMTTTLQAQECYDACAVENDPYRRSFQGYSEKTKPYDQRKTASEVHDDDNRHKLISRNHDRQIHLDQLLLQKKVTFRSAMTEKVMLSSRHFSKDSGNKISLCSVLHEDSGFTECSPNVSNEYFSYSNHTAAQNLSTDWADCERQVEFEGINDSISSIQNESVAVSESSNDRTGACTHFEDHRVETHTHTCSETSNTNCLQGSACCYLAEMLSSFSEEPKEVYSANQPQEVVNFLHDCKGDVGDAAKYIFQNQIKDKADARFNLHLVNCLLLPSLASLPKSFTSSWRSSTAPVSVTSGLIIPCDSHILEKLHMNGQSLVTLLISGDLTPNFHHKGYVPTLSKRTIIAKPHGGHEESDERIWCADVLGVINQLNAKLLLVKGKACSVLVDMCEGAGVLLLANISYHTLSVLSYVHGVDIVTYLALATEATLCNVCLQPLSTTWMDNLQDTQSNTAVQFAVITGTPDVQTAVIHCSNTMSAQLLEERLWKSLHSIANSQTDAQVLPGQGKTEIWCAKRLRYKSGCMLGNQSSVQSVILEAVADIFQDYYRMVKLNIQFCIEEYTQKKNVAEINPVLTTQCRNYVGFLKQNCCSKIHYSPHETSAFFESQTNNESFKTVTGNHMTQSVNIEADIFKSKESGHLTPSVCNMLNSSSADTFSDISSAEHNIYDNFKSKISAWKTAVDVVSVLQSLGSLVISGIDTVDMTESMPLL